MKRSTWRRIEAQFEQSPISRGQPGTKEEIDAAASAVGFDFDQDYREFLLRYGSANVGPNPVFGVRPCKTLGTEWSVVKETLHFREQRWPGVEDWYIVSVDGRGNPVGITPDGKVWMSDHDVGDIPNVARSFEDYLLQSLKLGEEE